MIDKKSLSERDICTKFITPEIEKAGWDKHTQMLEEVSFRILLVMYTGIGKTYLAFQNLPSP
jgi:type I site-specific restriction endonuclease